MTTMKRVFTATMVSVFCATLFSGCYKDKGNYDYQEINEVAISADVPDTVSVMLQDFLRINITIGQTAPSGNEYEYDWVLYQNIAAPLTRWTLGDSKDLEVQITQPPGQYKLDYFVKDMSTGVSFLKRFIVNVVGKFSEGWLVIEESGGTCDISMITPVDSIFRNIYSSANNGEKLPIGTHRINVVRDRTGLQKIFVMSPSGLTQPYYVDFLKVASFEDLFWGVPSVASPQEYFIQGSFNEVLLNNGKPHGMSTNAPAPYKLGLEPPGTWEVEPYEIYGTANGFIFYDKLSQAFYKYNLTNMLPFAAPPPDAVFNVNNVGKKLLFAGASSATFYDCLFKNNNDDSLFVFRLNAAVAQPAVDTAFIPDNQAPGLLNATKFVNSRLLPHLYYVSGNVVYLLDIPARQSRILYTLPAGATVTSMKMYLNPRVSSDPANNRRIAISTTEAGGGKVYIFDLAATGDFEGNTYSKLYTGFNTINDIALKWAP